MYDTIIIGAGLSGLAAGIRLAYYERPVCIVEKHTTIGGLNSFYRLRKRDHDVGLHAVTNYAKPGTKTGPLSKLLRQLRLRWEDFDLTPQCGSAVAFPGVTLRFTNEFAVFEQQIAEHFPAQIDGFQRLVKRINAHDELNLASRETSAREIVSSEITDPLLVDMIFCPLMFYGSPTAHDMDFTQFVIMFKAIFEEGFARPYEGVRRIMRKLVQQFRGFGGELRLRSGVQRILSENGRATGVQLENGTVLEAKQVVSSAGSAETMRLCDITPPDAEPYRPGGISFVETIFSLDCLPADLGHPETIIFYNDHNGFVYDAPAGPIDLRSGIICSPNNFQYDRPLDDGRVRITALANPGYWMTLPEDKYVAEKETWTARIVQSALRFMPDFRSHVVDTDTFTPRTITKFTSHLHGAVYGAPHKIRSGRTHLENLFLCGTDQGFLGIIGSMLSGITIANLHLLKAP
ncbi:MAG TPA: NAD(P)/FAD-dependent oxidoreductase [Planctomycetaceae bacterium]|nr:NAD(P)/FAD-dependent oxidoreductase [Planctomycetaceae bacterium]